MNEQEQLGSEILDALTSAESVVAKLVHENEELEAQLEKTKSLVDELAEEAKKQCEIACKLRDKLFELRWIPVSESKPKERPDKVPWSVDVEVIVGKTFDKAAWVRKNEFWMFTSGQGHPQPVTHWRYVILPGGV